MEKNHFIKEFKSKNTSIYFIYSFLFSKLETERNQKILGEALKSYGYSPAKSPLKMKGFASYLEVNERVIEFDFFQGEGRVRKKNGKEEKVIIKKSIICYRTGHGAYIIKITIDRSLKIEEINGFLLIGEDEAYHIKLNKDLKFKPLFQLFIDDLKLITDKWKSEIGKDIWLERKEKIINPDEHYQNPFVYTELELSKEIYNAAIIKGTEYHKELASILYRVKERDDWKFVDETYLRTYENSFDSRLANMHLHSKLFISFHTRSCIAICFDRNKPPANYFFPALINTVCLIRCRWHSYVIYNKYLDDKILGLNQEFADRKYNDSQFLRKIIEIRELLASSLEDPITWKRASGSLAEVYEEGFKRFRIKELEDLMIEKMKMLDRLYEDLREQRRLETREKLKQNDRDVETIANDIIKQAEKKAIQKK